MANGDSNSYTDRQRVGIAQQEYGYMNSDGKRVPYQFGQQVKLDDGTCVGYVAQVVSEPNGLQAYVVTDGKPPSNPPSKEWMNQQQHVTVLYQGTQVSSQAGVDVWGPDLLGGAQSILGGSPLTNELHGTPLDGPLGGLGVRTPEQYHASSDLLQDVLSKYGHADVDVYGHSLGSMDGQYALANLSEGQMGRVHGYLFEGTNVWNSLTDDQKRRARELNKLGSVHRYTDWRDIIGDAGAFGGLGNLGDMSGVGDMTILNSKNAGGSWFGKWFLNQHDMHGYQFNDDGSLMTFDPAEGYSKAANIALGALDEDRKELAAENGGKLTDDDKIWLDEQEAAAVVAGMRGMTAQEVQGFDAQVVADEEKAEEEWRGTLSDARWIGGDLSDEGIMDALEAGGATKKSICDGHKRRLESAKTAFHKATGDFDDLAGRIDRATATLVASDSQLATQLSNLGTK